MVTIYEIIFQKLVCCSMIEITCNDRLGKKVFFF